MQIERTRRGKYVAAKAHVDALFGFYIHLFVFICVMSGLFGINYAIGSPWWVQWPLIGWGLGILGHAMCVFSSGHASLQRWKRRRIRNVMAKM